MAKGITVSDAVAAIVVRLGSCSIAQVMEEAIRQGILRETSKGRAWTSNSLFRAKKRGLILSDGPGRYKPVDWIDEEAMVGVPDPGLIPIKHLLEARKALLESGRRLNRCHDYSKHSAKEVLEAALREHSRLGGLLDLMIGLKVERQ